MKTLPERYEIINAELWSPRQPPQLSTLVVSRGRVEAVEPQAALIPAASQDGAAANHQIDLKGRALLPAGVDLQVHTRVPGQPEKEDAVSSLSAAIKGGYGLILSMPNTRPVLDSVESLELAEFEIKKAQENLPVKVLWSAALSLGQQGRELAPIAKLAAAGARAFTDDGVGLLSDALMEQAYKVLGEGRFPLLQHAEMPGHGAALAEGPLQKRLGLSAYPESAEWEMVERDLKLLERYPGTRYHLLHVSSAKSIELIAKAKDRGLAVTAEVTPHHLHFCSEDIVEGKTAFKMNPPLRSARDRQALREALRSGVIDFVSTDHAPHEAKLKGPDFRSAAFGTLGMESSLSVLMSLYRQNELSAQRLVQLWATQAAQFIGEEADFGDIGPGRKLMAVAVDPRGDGSAFGLGDLASRCQNSCFLGAMLPPRPKAFFHGHKLFAF